MSDDRPLPQTDGHPLWPAFKEWAADHLPNLMLAAFWECWKAAHAAGHRSGQHNNHRNGQPASLPCR